MKKSIIILVIVVFALLQLPVLAQSDGPGDPGNDPELGGDPPLGAPLDGGTIFLIGLGIIYGTRKYFSIPSGCEELEC
jgi:hypothetical protein